MEKDKLYRTAEQRVEAKIGFITHLTVYVLVNLMLVVINILQSNDTYWSVWPLLGWGIGLACHGLRVLMDVPIKNYKEKMIQEELNNM
ncbi:MAG: hypothetical protein D3926_17610 [Desulfobacteraceae bacterium]|nr:MAG: hypothetical protein D3926_17610 [Desulfobacteraceae bacterium]